MSGTPISEYPEITRDMLELRSEINSAYIEITSLRSQLDDAKRKAKRRLQRISDSGEVVAEALRLVAALPYSSEAGELETTLKELSCILSASDNGGGK